MTLLDLVTWLNASPDWYGQLYSIIALVSEAAAFLANILTILISSGTLYFYLYNKDRIHIALDSMSKFALQGTLTGLRQKLERLVEYDADLPNEIESVRHILHEIAGQISGNPMLSTKYPELAKQIENVGRSRKLSEAQKRLWYERLKELFSSIELHSIHKQSGAQDVE
jgi:hypothetical protein